MTTASEHFQAGQLAEAIAAATAEVKKHPTETDRRGLLAELLCFAGEFERADKQLDTWGHQDPQAIPGISMLRQLVRAEVARQEFYSKGRLPEFLGEPTEVMKLHLEASIAWREGNESEAAAKLAEAEDRRVHVAGVCAGEAFADLRDLDDLTSSFFEVLTSTGKYYWIPMESVESIQFHPPDRPHDLLWRRTTMAVQDGPDGEVFLPTLYAPTCNQDDDQLRLGRGTDWIGDDGGVIRGLGQRMFLFGDEDKPIMSLREITFGKP